MNLVHMKYTLIISLINPALTSPVDKQSTIVNYATGVVMSANF